VEEDEVGKRTEKMERDEESHGVMYPPFLPILSLSIPLVPLGRWE